MQKVLEGLIGEIHLAAQVLRPSLKILQMEEWRLDCASEDVTATRRISGFPCDVADRGAR